ncbi:hypothetical protein RB195_016244 [Necator americanus]|uniref:Uncharacterized protein n=1 Tax=Necator americanus TaxID=51031 RepID=A0ABR1EA39_NECAM
MTNSDEFTGCLTFEKLPPSLLLFPVNLFASYRRNPVLLSMCTVRLWRWDLPKMLFTCSYCIGERTTNLGLRQRICSKNEDVQLFASFNP